MLCVHHDSLGTRTNEQPPCRYLPGAIRDGQRGWPVSMLPDSSIRGDMLHHISLVKACHRAADILGRLRVKATT